MSTPLSKEHLKELFNLNLTNKPFWISKKLAFLGEVDSCQKIKESALVYLSKDGLVLIVGCSHCGIKNIIERAKKIFNTEKINTVIGGLHLVQNKNRATELGKYFKSQNIKKIYPVHCCDLESKITLSQDVGIKEVFCGSIIDI